MALSVTEREQLRQVPSSTDRVSLDKRQQSDTSTCLGRPNCIEMWTAVEHQQPPRDSSTPTWILAAPPCPTSEPYPTIVAACRVSALPFVHQRTSLKCTISLEVLESELCFDGEAISTHVRSAYPFWYVLRSIFAPQAWPKPGEFSQTNYSLHLANRYGLVGTIHWRRNERRYR